MLNRLFLLCVLLTALHPLNAVAQTQPSGKNSRPHAIMLPQFVPEDPNQKFPCHNAPFTVSLGGQTYKVMRLNAMEYTPIGANMPVTSRLKGHPSRDCALSDGGAVQSFSTGFVTTNDVSLQLSAPAENPLENPPSTYSLNKENLDVAKKDALYRRLPYGASKATMDNVELYTFPANASPTKNGEPVILYCAMRKDDPKNLCKTSYQLPDGNYLSYYFIRGSFKEDMYASVDKMVRDRIEKMKVAAAAAPAEAQENKP